MSSADMDIHPDFPISQAKQKFRMPFQREESFRGANFYLTEIGRIWRSREERITDYTHALLLNPCWCLQVKGSVKDF